jgi:hypothetical protein
MPADSIRDIIQAAGEQFRSLLLQAYETGRREGEEIAKQRVLDLFGSPESGRDTANADSQAEPVGNIARPLLAVIQMMPIGGDGLGANEILEFANQQPGSKFNIWQVRSGMKTLEKRGDLIRVARGKYQLRGTHLERSEDGPESEASDSSELFGAPKPNGAEQLKPYGQNV